MRLTGKTALMSRNPMAGPPVAGLDSRSDRQWLSTSTG